METEEGLVSFVRKESLNPQRIPSFIVSKFSVNSKSYEPLLDNDADNESQYVGIQTDYSEKGKGVITPQMIMSTLDKAKVISAE